MTITYQLESWEDYYRDCQELWLQHYDEIAVDKAHMAMSPDVDTYKILAANGQLQVLTAREKGVMIGYQVTVIRRHMHYATLCGFEDSYFLTKANRKGITGVRLIQNAIAHMRQRGVKKVFFLTKMFLDRGKIFSFLGFSKSDEMYSKWIGG